MTISEAKYYGGLITPVPADAPYGENKGWINYLPNTTASTIDIPVSATVIAANLGWSISHMRLPDARRMPVGKWFEILMGTELLSNELQDATGNDIAFLNSNYIYRVVLRDNSSLAGLWVVREVANATMSFVTV